jgi:tetratricopeptide (TPR) repeat protein
MADLLRQVNWSAFLLHVLLIVLFPYLLSLVNVAIDLGLLISSLSYMGLSVILQRIIPVDHRMGFSLLIQKNYEAAALAFQKSWDYFNKKTWLDNYRAILMLSASKISYREMALINRSLCYWHIGDTERALESYREVLSYFPNSKMAKDAIYYIENPDGEAETTTEEDEYLIP